MSTEIKERIDNIRQSFRSVFLDELRESYLCVLDAVETLDNPIKKEDILTLIEKDLRKKISSRAH